MKIKKIISLSICITSLFLSACDKKDNKKIEHRPDPLLVGAAQMEKEYQETKKKIAECRNNNKEKSREELDSICTVKNLTR